MTSKYVIYGGELSYFTRKLEAALIFYGADYEIQRKTATTLPRSNTAREPIRFRFCTRQRTG